MASIEKRDGKYRIRWRDPSGQARSRTAPTLRAARALKQEVEEACALGRTWQPAGVGEAPDLPEMHRAFLSEIAAYRKPGTVTSYAARLNIWEHWLRQAFPDQRLTLQLLSRATLAAFLQDITSSGRNGGRKPATCSALLRTVQAVWRWAADDPTYGPYVNRPRMVPSPPVPIRKVWAPSWAEMDTAIRSTEGYAQRAAILARFTGLRINQILSLRWDDLAGDELTIRGELGKSRLEQKGRTVPISSHLAVELSRWDRSTRTLVGVEGPWTEFYVRRALLRAWPCTEIGDAPWEGRPLHGFRSGFQTGMANAGIREDTIKFLVGHSGGTSTHYIDRGRLAREAVQIIPPIDWDGGADPVVSTACPARRPKT